MNMKIAGLVAVIALLAGPAWAQMPNRMFRVPASLTRTRRAAQIEAEKEAERAYKRSLGNIQEQKSADPWGTVRSDNAPPKAGAQGRTGQAENPEDRCKARDVSEAISQTEASAGVLPDKDAKKVGLDARKPEMSGTLLFSPMTIRASNSRTASWCRRCINIRP